MFPVLFLNAKISGSALDSGTSFIKQIVNTSQL